MTLEPGDLPDALRDLMQTAGAASGVRCRCEIRTRMVLRDSSVATHLYRIAQEAVNNARSTVVPAPSRSCSRAVQARFGC